MPAGTSNVRPDWARARRTRRRAAGALAGALRIEHHDGRRFVVFDSAASAARAAGFLALLVPRPEIGYAAPTAAAPDATTVEPAQLSVPPALAAAGCSLLLDFVGAAEASQLLADVDAHPWDSSLARRTQQHGRKFDYTTKNVAPHGAAIPPCFDGLLARLAAVPRHVLPWDGLADNLTVNEYLPGAGIANHVDTHSAFEDGICALTLGDGCAMRLQRRDESHVIWLPPRALLVLSGASRYEWSHAIAMRRHDVLESGERVARGRRVSLTLRRGAAGRATARFRPFAIRRAARRSRCRRVSRTPPSPPAGRRRRRPPCASSSSRTRTAATASCHRCPLAMSSSTSATRRRWAASTTWGLCGVARVGRHPPLSRGPARRRQP